MFPPEEVHYFSMNALKLLFRLPFARRSICRDISERTHSPKVLFGLQFRNIIGLGAGFDKNARYLTELEALGFGFVEIGTVTPLPQDGNEKPRLFRLPKDKALINRMGFNNDGVKIVSLRLKDWKEKNGSRPATDGTRLIIGGNIGKNKSTPNEDAWKDYELCFRELYDDVDYFVVNVSSPNTPGLRQLQEKESLRKILVHLQNLSLQQPQTKPVLLKIAPDLSLDQLDDIIDLALEIKLDGLVVTNTTISRENLQTPVSIINKIGPGGLSGKPLKEKSLEISRYIKTKSNGVVPYIASGGVFTAEDVTDRLDSGASLVQVWTGFVYSGPLIVKKIFSALRKNKELMTL